MLTFPSICLPTTIHKIIVPDCIEEHDERPAKSNIGLKWMEIPVGLGWGALRLGAMSNLGGEGWMMTKGPPLGNIKASAGYASMGFFHDRPVIEDSYKECSMIMTGIVIFK